jgi:hypothetical protein
MGSKRWAMGGGIAVRTKISGIRNSGGVDARD